MKSADALYRLLLRSYPEDFRAAYAREMTMHFRDMHRDAHGRGAGFWFAIVWDVAKTASEMRLRHLRGWWKRNNHIEETAMLIMGILAMLVGAFEVVNSLIEVRYGVAGGGGSWSLAVGLDGVLSGALLIAAGVALLGRIPKAVTLARVASIYCLATFGLVLAIRPMFSVFASLLGIGFPIILLAYLYLRGRGASAPRVA